MYFVDNSLINQRQESDFYDSSIILLNLPYENFTQHTLPDHCCASWVCGDEPRSGGWDGEYLQVLKIMDRLNISWVDA